MANVPIGRTFALSVCRSVASLHRSRSLQSLALSLSFSLCSILFPCAGHLSYLVRIEIIPVVYFYCCNYTSASQSGESSPEHSRSHRIYLSIVLFRLGNSALFGFCTIPSSSVTQSKYKKKKRKKQKKTGKRKEISCVLITMRAQRIAITHRSQ